MKVLAFDFGASSGRAIIIEKNSGKLELTEVHRFNNDVVEINGTIYWDVLRLFYEIKQGILKASREHEFDALGIDTWGVDFGLIDKNGNLIGNPVNYRDLRTEKMPEYVFSKISKDDIYKKTGIQFMRINTLYQLAYLAKEQPEIMDMTEKILFMPDLFAYFLTGEMRMEETIASTSNIVDPRTKEIDKELMEKIGISKDIFCKPIEPGEIYGTLKPELAKELNCKEVPVVAVATHDTASAIVAVPSAVKDFVYVSCGTWSLFGTENEVPVINEQSSEANYTNEGGFGKTTRFLKNIMGLWIFQETCRQWQREGKTIDYKEIDKAAMEAEPFKCLIDPDYPEFETPGNIPERIREYAKKTNQPVPETDGELVRTIYESLALKYKYNFEKIKKLTGKNYEYIHMVGGGIKAKPICEFAASACNVTVVAGPVEATATGNGAVQFMALNQIADLKEARKIVADSTHIDEYKPQNPEKWDEVYEFYKKNILAE